MSGGSAKSAPPTITEYVEQLLLTALDTGLKEFDFWEMTIAEVVRHIESYNRTYKQKAQEKASYDYTLASLIVRGVSITLGAKDTFPTIQDVYSDLFVEEKQAQEEIVKERQATLSALRFKQFAQSYNKKYENKVVTKNNE